MRIDQKENANINILENRQHIILLFFFMIQIASIMKELQSKFSVKFETKRHT